MKRTKITNLPQRDLKYRLKKTAKVGFGVVVSLLFSTAAFAQSGDMAFSWGHGFGGKYATGNNSALGVATDKDGNVFVTGAYTGEMEVAGTILSSTPLSSGSGYSGDIYLIKYDKSGKVMWAKSFGGNNSDNSNSIDVDQLGNVYLTGTFYNKMGFAEDDSLASTMNTAGTSYSADAYLLKLDNDGNKIWARNIGGVGTEYGKHIRVDNDFNVYYAIETWSATPVDFNPSLNPEDTFFLAATNTSADMFLGKLDSSGNFVWAKGPFGGTGSDYPYGMDVDYDGNVILSGTFVRDATFGGITLTTGNTSPFSGTQGNAFVAKIDAAGQVLWAKKMGASNVASNGKGVSVDQDGDVYHIGYVGYNATSFPVDFGGDPINNIYGGSDIVVTKLKSDGAKAWVRVLGGNEADEGLSIAVDRVGNIYTTGSFRGKANFNPGAGGPFELVAAGTGQDAFINKMDNDGNFIWAKSFGTSNWSSGNQVYVDPSGNLILAGAFSGVITLNSGTGLSFQSIGNNGGFVLSLACNDTSLTEVVDSACRTYTYNDIEYTESGVYTQIFANASGCDSTISLDLTIYNLEVELVLENDVELSTSEEFDTYQWLLNGEEIEGATDSNYEALENGDYQVVVTNAFGCTDTSEVQAIETLAISSAFITNQIKIYPNPSNHWISIKSPVHVDIQLTTIDGREIFSVRDAQTISLENLAEGMYLLRISDAKGTFLKVEKIIKKNN